MSIHQQIFESVEGAIVEAINPQVWGVSVVIEPTRNVEITMFVQGVLPESERRYLAIVAQEILLGPPWVADVKINIHDHASQPLKPIGTWLFIRNGVQADRSKAVQHVQGSIAIEQTIGSIMSQPDTLEEHHDCEINRLRLPDRLTCPATRRILRRRSIELRPECCPRLYGTLHIDRFLP
jgi:hypothetical protein